MLVNYRKLEVYLLFCFISITMVAGEGGERKRSKKLEESDDKKRSLSC